MAIIITIIVVVFQSLSCVWHFATPWTTACQIPLAFSLSWSLLKFMSIELVMLSNHLILCCPLLLLPSIFLSITIFYNELPLCIRWPKYCSFTISLSSEYSGLIFFKIDWLDLLAVQGSLKSLLQHHNLKVSIPWRVAFYVVQHWHLHMTTGEIITLTICSFVGKVILYFLTCCLDLSLLSFQGASIF